MSQTQNSSMSSQVLHPTHYNHTGRSECWDEMVDISPEGTAIFDLWSAYKYSYRAGTKDGNPEEQDIAKIKNYINHAKLIHAELTFSDELELMYTDMLKALSKYL